MQQRGNRGGANGSLSPWRAITALVLAGLVAAVVFPLAACGGQTPGTVTVPVLWAAGSGSEARGGIEPATVQVTDGSGGFSVELSGIEAEGAGPAWLAASASAATVATLVSGSDPSVLDVRFGVTGPIDGPSGGAALAVGVLAAIRDLSLRPGVTMTGTVSPDGSVGVVGSVPTKVRAAANAGYERVLVPVRNITDRDPETGDDVVALGASLGVEVTAVADIAEALAAFTGTPVTDGPSDPVPLGPGVQTVATDTAQAMVDRLDQALAAADADAIELGAQRLATARTALAAGDVALAYGSATEGWLRLVRTQASTDAATVVARGDIRSFSAALDAEADALDAEARRLLQTWDPPAQWSSVQEFNLPAAMGWLTYATAALASARNALAGGSPSDLAGTAAVVAEQRAAIGVLWPDALAAVLALDAGSARWPADAAAFLSGYTTLLISAGEANEGYLDAVLSGAGNSGPGNSGAGNSGAGAGAAGSDRSTTAARAARSLAESDAGGPAAVSSAMTYWFITATAVSSRQSFGLVESGITGEPGVPVSPEVLTRAVDNARSTVVAIEGLLAGQGVDVGYVAWAAAWGSAAATADVGTTATAGELLALGELWYAAVNGFAQLAAIESAAIGSAAGVPD